MEKKQYELCLEILRRFHKTGILDYLTLVGSWCAPFYKDYFHSKKSFTTLRTRDIDFLINAPNKIKEKVDIPLLLKDLGFVVSFQGEKGYIRLNHPDLMLEFLVPEKGRGSDKPHPLPMLGLNATPLRFLDFLAQHTIEVEIENFVITLPHPIYYALHKLIIVHRRQKEDKAIKDRQSGIDILNALIHNDEIDEVKKVFNSIPKKWQNKIKSSLEKAEESHLLELLL
ncbi:MAG: hypothetical protein A2Z91_09090 [Deltaproteobacteria bacterium GWA2_38_16]|nr:MAG: hypothetical protein A2Z91_09090 [Deltaproteobacteria bacterium GWA2_38_16]OGQ02547.1 MAG: hypothetical protein A3D19_09640 [Deltaproteobacteria bacterium RIFCSPHIGHO2_02_FULL_38_15]OGQ60375.1 MAG: hypothetical protein A3G92_03290 [Deltaproteobacteria bacterium RIFCSPLOWO2_12_FULL_38_8]HBQ20998.1 hypothetical protein [Deltaproteobacteria bacterium]